MVLKVCTDSSRDDEFISLGRDSQCRKLGYLGPRCQDPKCVWSLEMGILLGCRKLERQN
jgi:hypothetical protein